MSPPVLGFNNNVRHRGRVFHIQTEDSGVRNPRIVTHLFADGGRIIKTIRTDYTAQLDRADLATHVRQLMKRQHKAMFSALRAGELDAALESACGPLPQPPAAEPAPISTGPLSETLDSARGAELARAAENAHSAESARNLEAARVAGSVRAAAEPARAASEPKRPTDEREARTSGPVPRKPRSERPTLSRPASRYGSGPLKSSQSIFGDTVISEKSLDEVILSYLADDLEGSSD